MSLEPGVEPANTLCHILTGCHTPSIDLPQYYWILVEKKD